MGALLKKLGAGCLKLVIAFFAMLLITHVSWKYTAIGAVLYFYARWLLEGEDERASPAPVIDVSQLSPLGYEDYCAVLLRDAGWRASTTPRQDQGVDVIASLRGTRAAIQCKMYASPVGNRAVQEVIAGRLYYGTQIAVVVSTAPYTLSARALAARTQVLLLHHDQLPLLEQLARIP
ncbi:MAG: restriction endonuclease [Xanthobacteraceae bacterium]